jgi:outer membrane protein assembly factor BamB
MNRAGRRICSLCAAAALALALGCGRETAEWPQFRGPAGIGISDAGGLPAKWGKGSANIRWRAPLPGRGNSSPVVAADRVYLTAVIAQRPHGAAGGEAKPASFDRAVLALDLATGKLLWQTTVFSGRRLKGHRYNTDAAPTPVTDGESVYAYFGSHLARLTRDGRVAWAKEVDPTYARFVHYGVASSPILVDDTVVVVQDQEEGHNDDIGWMAAYDRETGDPVWRRQWNDTCCSYSTPLLWRRPGADQELLFAHSGLVVGHDPRTGERLWRHEYNMLQFVGGLVAQGDVICALGGAHHNKGNLCIRVTGPGRSAKVEELWYERRRAPETSSAVLYGGRLYAITEGGVMSCYDPVSGELHWAEHLEPGRGFRASLVAGDGKVYAYPTRGPTAVIDATTDEYRVLAWNDLEEGGNNATPAIAGGCLLLRTDEHLFCIEKEAPAG